MTDIKISHSNNMLRLAWLLVRSWLWRRDLLITDVSDRRRESEKEDAE